LAEKKTAVYIGRRRAIYYAQQEGSVSWKQLLGVNGLKNIME
jgi:hypothetical protein